MSKEKLVDELQKRGILYAPDYVINAGGLINVYGELNDWSTPCRRLTRNESFIATSRLRTS